MHAWVGCDYMADAWYMYIRKMHLSGFSFALGHIALHNDDAISQEHVEDACYVFVNSQQYSPVIDQTRTTPSSSLLPPSLLPPEPH